MPGEKSSASPTSMPPLDRTDTRYSPSRSSLSFDAASTAHDEAARDLKRKKSSLKLAKARYQRLEKETKRASKLAKAAGVKRYVLPSSCSIYGFQDREVQADLRRKLGHFLAMHAQFRTDPLPVEHRACGCPKLG